MKQFLVCLMCGVALLNISCAHRAPLKTPSEIAKDQAKTSKKSVPPASPSAPATEP